MNDRDFKPNYICWQSRRTISEDLTFDEILGFSLADDSTYFAFQSNFEPYQQFGHLQSHDVVIRHGHPARVDKCALEVKMTALPDFTTSSLAEDKYGCEIVIRAHQIFYLAASLALNSPDAVKNLASSPLGTSVDWKNAGEVTQNLREIANQLDHVLDKCEANQRAFLLQQIWKTKNISTDFAEDCLDVFIWSDLAFAKFIQDVGRPTVGTKRIKRQQRTLVWLYRMLFDIAVHGQTDHAAIIDQLTYNVKNDKAFSETGKKTHEWMNCPNLSRPRISKQQIPEIILNGGQFLLSPERRFDAALCNNPNLFSIADEGD